MDARLGLAVASARCVSGLSRALRIGGGTAAPGIVAGRVDPRALEKLSLRLGRGVVVVAGTNGKTTTARMLAEILARDGRRVLHNRAGANLVTGIVSTLAAGVAVDRRSGSATAVLETDESALPEVLRRTTQAVVVLTNLFRDQLDRYGELDLILGRWRAALTQLSPSTTLVVNADDPSLVALTDGLSATRRLFGIGDSIHRLAAVPHSAEVLSCRTCDLPLQYHSVYVGHLGDWYCPACRVARPDLDVSASAVELKSADSQSFEVSGIGASPRVDAGVPGLYNTYNVLAALTAADVLDVRPDRSLSAVACYRAAFGRAELVMHRGRRLRVMLVKNPVGCDEVLRTISGANGRLELPLLLCLNDAASDGRDVSWIWDVDFERLAGSSGQIGCAGSRWADLRNRLYYAGVSPDRIRVLGPDLRHAVDAFTCSLEVGASGFILPTYTAMVDIHQNFAADLHLRAFWEE